MNEHTLRGLKAKADLNEPTEYGGGHQDATLKDQWGSGRFCPQGQWPFTLLVEGLTEGKKACNGAQVILQRPV